jgi:hypothetical protein
MSGRKIVVVSPVKAAMCGKGQDPGIQGQTANVADPTPYLDCLAIAIAIVQTPRTCRLPCLDSLRDTVLRA